MIRSRMLPRQLILPPHPPAKLTPSLSYSCSLLCASPKVNSHQINSLQPLLQNTGGVPVHGVVGCTDAQKCPSVSPLFATLTHSMSRKSFACHSYANTQDGGVTPPPISASVLATPILFANPFSRKSFLFTSIQILGGCHLCGLCAPTSVASVLSPFLVGPNCRLRDCCGMRENLLLRVPHACGFSQRWVPYFPQRALRPSRSAR